MFLFRFLIKILFISDFLRDGLRWDYIILIGRFLMVSKFMVFKVFLVIITIKIYCVILYVLRFFLNLSLIMINYLLDLYCLFIK